MQKLEKVAFALSLIALLLAIIGAFGYDLWLASTQWLLISIALTAYAIYLKVCR